MKQMFAAAGLDRARVTSRCATGTTSTSSSGAVEAELGFPCFVKPANMGSSVGREQGAHARGAARRDRARVHVRRVDARRGDGRGPGDRGRHPRRRSAGASLPGEVVPAADFYDYADKYEDGKAELRAPAPLSAEQTAEVQRARGARVRGVPRRGDGPGRLLPSRRRRLRRERGQHDPRLHADLDVPAALGGLGRALRRAARPAHRPRDRPGRSAGPPAAAASGRTRVRQSRTTRPADRRALTPSEEAAMAVSAYILDPDRGRQGVRGRRRVPRSSPVWSRPTT